jgi:hypothetical protein
MARSSRVLPRPTTSRISIASSYLDGAAECPRARVSSSIERLPRISRVRMCCRSELLYSRVRPRVLGGIYDFEFKRYFPDLNEYAERWRPVIETICAAREPLPLADLGRLFPTFYTPNEITNGLGSLFPDSGGRVRPFHQSVRDWVTQENRAGRYLVSVDPGHRLLADEGWRQYQSNSQTRLLERMNPYFVLHLTEHLNGANAGVISPNCHLIFTGSVPSWSALMWGRCCRITNTRRRTNTVQ